MKTSIYTKGDKMNKSKCDTRLNGKCLSGIWSGKRINESICKYCSQNKNRKAGRPSTLIPRILAAHIGYRFEFTTIQESNNCAMCAKRLNIDAYQITDKNALYPHYVIIGKKPKK
ncbi:MAG: hypothetical protein WC389_10515 [Lutibacter sp.]|jgi:hypothetical protein